MLRGSVLLTVLHICKPRLLSQENTYMASAYFVASCISYFGVGVFWQPSYSICYVMLIVR
jgi:hypothetical protein